MKNSFTISILLFCLCNSINGQSILLKQNHENGIYKSGDKARITFFSSDKSIDSITVKIQKDFSKQTLQKFSYRGDTLELFNETLKEPITLVFDVKTDAVSESIGLICDTKYYKPSTECPKNFKKFWNKQKESLRELPLLIKSDSVTIKDPNYRCYNVEINCTGPKPARGYFAKPISGKPKSLPIVIYFHAAGVNGDWCRSKPEIALRYAKEGKGTLCFDLNAHGMLNGQSNDYYNRLDSTELKNYAQIGVENRATVYFRGMYLRLLQTIEFLIQQPEWDGKRILVIGESQGGGQALAAAGFDKRVSAVVATVPAMCNWGATLEGRKGSWPYPFETSFDRKKMLETMPYFDVVHVLRGSKATIVVEIGLIDQTCPSSNILAALNQAKGKKIIFTAPYRAHHFTQQAYKEIWNKTVNKPKEDFINDYLK